MSDIVVRDPNTGRGMSVDSEGRAEVAAVVTSRESHANWVHGEAYSAPFACDPDGAADCFFYLKNQDDKDLIVEGLELTAAGADEIYVVIGATGTAVKTNGADITPVNLNAGSGNEADVLCYSNTADGAVDITGLSGGSTVKYIWITAAATTAYFNHEQDIIIPKNYTYSLWAVGGDAAIRGTVLFHFHDTD